MPRFVGIAFGNGGVPMSNVPRCEPVYRGECKQCGHLIERSLDKTVPEANREERFRCARCGQINLLSEVEPEADSK